MEGKLSIPFRMTDTESVRAVVPEHAEERKKSPCVTSGQRNPELRLRGARKPGADPGRC
jgi:hypothetical protein